MTMKYVLLGIFFQKEMVDDPLWVFRVFKGCSNFENLMQQF